MAEKQQDLGQEQGRGLTLGNAAQELVGSMAIMLLEETLANGKNVSIPSLGIEITSSEEKKED